MRQDPKIHKKIWDLLEENEAGVDIREVVEKISNVVAIDPETARRNMECMIDKGVLRYTHVEHNTLAVEITGECLRWKNDSNSGLTPMGVNYTTEIN